VRTPGGVLVPRSRNQKKKREKGNLTHHFTCPKTRNDHHPAHQNWVKEKKVAYRGQERRTQKHMIFLNAKNKKRVKHLLITQNEKGSWLIRKKRGKAKEYASEVTLLEAIKGGNKIGTTLTCSSQRGEKGFIGVQLKEGELSAYDRKQKKITHAGEKTAILLSWTKQTSLSITH